MLVRITDDDGNSTRPPTGKQMERHRSTGSAIAKNCWMCRKYMEKGKYHSTTFCCRYCSTPICHGVEGRPSTCIHEHLNSPHYQIRCDGKAKTTFPDSLKVHP